MKKMLSCALIAISLLCSCGAKKGGEYTSNASYEDCRAWYLNYMSDTTNYDGYFLIFGDDGNGFVPVSDMLEPLKFEEKRNSKFVDTLVWLYNATQLLDAMIYDCGTIDRYNGDFNPEPYADAIGGIDVSGIDNEELSDAFLALSQAIAKDIRNGQRTDTIYYDEILQLHGVMDKLFDDFVDSHRTRMNYNCSKYVADYEKIHAKAITDTAHYRDELLQMAFDEEDFEKRCIYAREFAYANYHNLNGETVDVIAVIEPLLLTTEYSPLLFDLWLIWRTALQGGVLSGLSNDSSMYNLFYNGVRRRVAYRYITRLNENPHDELAFNGLLRLIYRSSIIRNSDCYVGNNCFLDQMDIYEQCAKR